MVDGRACTGDGGAGALLSDIATSSTARFDAKGAEHPHEEQGRVAARYLGVFFSLDLNWSKTVGRLKSSVGLAMARLRQARAPHWVQHEVMLAMVASRAAFAAQVEQCRRVLQ